MYTVQIKRIYQPAQESDGYRILVDRVWPRGISKAEARLDEWAQAIAPSSAIRKEFGHEPAKMPVFREKYRDELNRNPAAGEFLKAVVPRLRTTPVTPLYGARDEQNNQAVVLKEWLEENLTKIK